MSRRRLWGGRSARILVAVLLITVPKALAGQPRSITNEVRLDGRFSRITAIEAGGSIILPSGIYARTSLTGGFGFALRDSTWGSSARVEVTSRFLLDPFRESTYGLSVGGGVGLTNSGGRRSADNNRPYLLVIADLELRQTTGWTPAIQVGLGAGFRLGVLVRSGTGRLR